MSLQLYKVIHLSGVAMMLFALGGLCFHALGGGCLRSHLAVVESPTASPLKEGEPGFIKGRHDLVWKEVFEDGPRPSN